MSDSDEVVVTKRRTNRLNLDSEEEARIEAEEQRRIDQLRLRKEEKRRKRQEQARQAEEQQRKKAELERHFEDPRTMMEPDSDSKYTFDRAEKKIRKAFPDLKAPKQQNHGRRKMVSESDDSDSGSQDEDQSESQSESQSEDEESAPKKKKIQKQVKRDKKERKRQENIEQMRAARHKAKEVKLQEKDPKEILVSELAIRWWYCLPEWPPADFDYEAALNKQGYRLVGNDKFRIEENLVDGLLKATPIDGYVGIYKTKTKLIDVRPKETCPTLNFLRNKTIQQLTNLLRVALKEQIRQLQAQKYKTTQDEELLVKLKKRLNLLG